jgi:hypothetical protein
MEEIPQNNPEMKQETALVEDVVPVCPNCLQPCNRLEYYCPNCGSNDPINPLASYMPFVDLRFNTGMIGKLWGKAWASDTQFIVRVIYLLMFMVFSPVVLLIGLSFIMFEKPKFRNEEPIDGQ